MKDKKRKSMEQGSLVPKQARMERQITAGAGEQTTDRNCDKRVSLPQTKGALLPSRLFSLY